MDMGIVDHTVVRKQAHDAAQKALKDYEGALKEYFAHFAEDKFVDKLRQEHRINVETPQGNRRFKKLVYDLQDSAMKAYDIRSRAITMMQPAFTDLNPSEAESMAQSIVDEVYYHAQTTNTKDLSKQLHDPKEQNHYVDLYTKEDSRFKDINVYIFKGEKTDSNYGSRFDKASVHQPKKNETLPQAIATYVKGPAICILDIHGSEDRTARWHEGEVVNYDEIYSSMPPKVKCIAVGSCFGGGAINIAALKHAPKNSIVFSLTTSHSLTAGSTIGKYGTETEGLKNPVDYYIESLLSTSSQAYTRNITSFNNKFGEHFDTNPDHAVPNLLGFGGPDGHIMNMAVESVIAAHRIESDHTSSRWKNAVAKVKNLFSSGHSNLEETMGLEKRIDPMIHQMEHGQTAKTSDEKRIAYALTAAYEEQDILKAIGIVQSPDKHAEPNVLQVSAPMRSSGKHHL